MPLSKKRMKERKRADRAKSRLDKQLCPPQGISPVKPKPQIEVDADGNIIPDY